MANKEEIIKLGQISVRYLAEGSDTNGQMEMFEFMVPVGAKVPLPHYHEAFDEIVYGLEGILSYSLNGERIEIHPGESIFVPRGAVHGFDNFGQQDTKTLCVITPGILGPQFFRDMGTVINAGGPPDVTKLKAVLANHGLVPVMPGQ